MTGTTTVAIDYAAWEAANRTRSLERIARLKLAVIPPLAGLGVTSAEVMFDGCGDSGAVEDIATHGRNGPLDAALDTIFVSVPGDDDVTAAISLDRALEDLATLALALHHPGWENNDGATGSLEIDVITATFTLDCKLRYTAYDDHYTAL